MQSDGVLLPAFPRVYAAGGGGNSQPGAGAAGAASYSEHKPKTPPPDLPSLLLDSRIVYLGMPVRASCLCHPALPFPACTHHACPARTLALARRAHRFHAACLAVAAPQAGPSRA
jgi:hypothetical protein